MSAKLWKSPTIKIMSAGHSLPVAECRAGAVVIGCQGVYPVMGYRSSDAERERFPAVYSRPETRRMILTGYCGTVPESVDRDGILLQCQLNPAGPDIWEEWNGVADQREISPGVVQDAAMMCW
jgi:hypothetical protein